MGASGPVRRDEFERFVRETLQWRGTVDEWRRAHDEWHDEAEEEQRTVEVRERRRWSWPEIIMAMITAGGVVAAATISTFGR